MSETSETTAVTPTAEEQIRALRDKLQAQREARKAETEPARAERELARLQREIADESAMAEAERKFGAQNVEHVRTDLGVVTVTKANPLVFNAYLDKGDTSHAAQMRLVLPCLTTLKASQFEKICEELPLTLLRAVDAIYLLAGAQQRDLAGKS